MSRFAVHTESGSTYEVERQNDRYFFHAPKKQVNTGLHNVPIRNTYEVEPIMPWPPQPGLRLLVVTKHFTDPLHPNRMPGGGKTTSEIMHVEELEP